MHDTWCAWLAISEHDIDNVRVAWQCGSKAPQTHVSKWHWSFMKLAVRASVNVAAFHHCVLIAYGESWDQNGKPNSVTVTGRMVSPSVARSFQASQMANLLWDALCVVMQAAPAILEGSL